MKNHKKAVIIALGVFLILPFFIANAKCATTIGDTTFSAEVDNVYVWEVTKTDQDYEQGSTSDKLNFTVEAIYQGQHAGVDALIVNYSLGHYDDTNFRWETLYDNAFYMAANETQNYFNISSTFIGWPIAYLIPTPINLSAVGLALSDQPNIDNYELKDSDRVFLNWVAGGITYKLTFDSSGILTRYSRSLSGLDGFVMEFNEELSVIGGGGGDDIVISYGYYFLIFALISVVGLIYFKKKDYK